jgi:GDP-L-fucose synthase
MDYWNGKRILLTGGTGFLGSHLLKKLVEERGINPSRIRLPRSSSCDLRFIENCKRAVKDIDVVIHLAARVGGIEYNRTHSGSLFYDNASMGLNMLEAARREGVKKIVTTGSVCAYPKNAPTPAKEEHLWSGYPEESNAAYGLAKKLILVQSQAYREQFDFNSVYLILANLYGPGDKFDQEGSHVIPALIRKMTEAMEKQQKAVTLWGSGKATRDFLYVKDAAEGILRATENYDKPEPVNLASCNEITIRSLSEIIKIYVGFSGEILWDTSRPNGQRRRLFDISRARREFDFNPETNLEEGLKETVKWYNEHRTDVN